jgi:hypothetical protein
MYNKENYINKQLQEVESVFIKHNQPTTIFLINETSTIIRQFGSNEGGPSYKIYVNTENVVIKIEENDIDYI